MKKTKKALLAALACTVVLAGGVGLAACGGGNGGGDEGHHHDYTWSPNNNGTHNGICADTDGKCDAKNVTNVPCDTNGADGACSDCGYKEDSSAIPVDYTNITLNTDVTVTGASFEAPKYYRITLAEGNYQILVGGVAVDFYSDGIGIGTSFTEDNYLNPEEPDSLNTYELAAGAYFVEVSSNVTFKVATAAEHSHEYGTEWISGAEGHWHVTDCDYHYGEKDEVRQHQYGAASAADEDGIVTKTCDVCEYVTSDISGLTATAVTGGLPDSVDYSYEATPVTAGTYKSTIAGVAGYAGYNPGDYYFKITCGDTPKTYTLKVLTTNTKITKTNNETIAEEAGDTYELVLRANQTFEFILTTLDETCGADYSCDVAFKITETAAPTEGTKGLPVILQLGENTKTADANQDVYYEIPSVEGSSKVGDLQITFGEGVSVTYLGVDVENEGESLSSGDKVAYDNFAWSTVYLRVSSTSGAVAFNVESVITPGKKGNPHNVTFGTDNANEVAFDIDNDVYEQWFKVTAATADKYVVKASKAGATFELYNSVDDEMPVSSGSVLILDLDANDTAYIKATHNESTDYTFTVTEATEADRGYSPNYAIEIKGSGEYNIPEAILGTYDGAFFTYTATADGTVTIAHTGAEYACFVRVNVDEYVETEGTSYSSSPVTIDAQAGHTYIISFYPEGLTDGTLTVTGVPQANVEIPFTSDKTPSEMQAVGTLYADELTWEGTGADTSKWNAGNAGEPATNALRVSTDTKITLKVAGEVTVSWYPGQGSDADILVYYDANGCATIEVVGASGKYMTGLTVNPNVIPPASKVINVTLDYDNGSENGTWKAVVGSVMNKPADPTKEGAKFSGWKLNGEDYDFTAAVPDVESLTLVAQWGAADADYDLTAGGTVKLYELNSVVLEGSSATYRGIIVDATSGKFDGTRSNDVMINGGTKIKFKVNAGTTAEQISATFTAPAGDTYMPEVSYSVETIEGQLYGVITFTKGQQYPGDMTVTIS